MIGRCGLARTKNLIEPSMGSPSHLKVGIGDAKGSGIRVEATVRDLALDPEDARPAGAA